MDADKKQKEGSIVCVGIGMTLGSHISPLARSYIEEADIVYVLVSDGIVEQWIKDMNSNVKSLQWFYHEGTSRRETYNAMTDVMVEDVKLGHKVVGAFYGHPGVFACVPHMVVKQVCELGYYGKLEPGISAEDCLYADLGIDPGEQGCAHYETSQFMFYKRNIETTAYLILWQVGIAGDTTLSQFSTGREHRKILINLLRQFYPADHQVVLYEAPTLPIHQPRKECISIIQLIDADINQHSTLVIPPFGEMERNNEIFKELLALAEKGPKLELV